MAATKDAQYKHSSEVGLAGEITQVCLVIAARLVKEASYRASSGPEGQQRPEESFPRKRSKLDNDRKNNEDCRYLRDGDCDDSDHEGRSGGMQGNRF
jgi:hypothetical protein